MSYIASGRFRADVEQVIGHPLEATHDEDSVEDGDLEDAEDEDDDKDPALSSFPDELRAEVEALDAFVEACAPPRLCALAWGDFCSVPWQNGADRDEVLEDWLDGDEAATDFVMSAVSIVHGGGGFYVLVNAEGRLGLLCEDPHSFRPLACSLPQFLKAILAAHQAACARGLDAAKAALVTAVDERTAKLLLTFAGRLTPTA